MSDLTLSYKTGRFPLVNMVTQGGVTPIGTMLELGSTGEYYYNFTNLSAGNYRILVKDGNEKLGAYDLVWDGAKEATPDTMANAGLIPFLQVLNDNIKSASLLTPATGNLPTYDEPATEDDLIGKILTLAVGTTPPDGYVEMTGGIVAQGIYPKLEKFMSLQPPGQLSYTNTVNIIKASASSYVDDPRKPEFAIDGSLESTEFSCWHSFFEPEPWFKIEFENISTITTLMLFSRGMDGEYSPGYEFGDAIEVSTSIDGDNFEYVQTFNNLYAENYKVISLNVNIPSTKYIKLKFFANNGYASIGEILAFNSIPIYDGTIIKYKLPRLLDYSYPQVVKHYIYAGKD
jgi:hypothetical protein